MVKDLKSAASSLFSPLLYYFKNSQLVYFHNKNSFLQINSQMTLYLSPARSRTFRRRSNSAQVKLGTGPTPRKSNSAQVKLCASQTRRRSNSAQVKLGAGQTRLKSNSAQVKLGAGQNRRRKKMN